MAVLGFPALLLAGLGFGRRRRFAFAALPALAIAALLFSLTAITGCSSSGMQPQTGPQSLSVTATAGSVSHTTMLTVNIQ